MFDENVTIPGSNPSECDKWNGTDCNYQEQFLLLLVSCFSLLFHSVLRQMLLLHSTKKILRNFISPSQRNLDKHKVLQTNSLVVFSEVKVIDIWSLE